MLEVLKIVGQTVKWFKANPTLNCQNGSRSLFYYFRLLLGEIFSFSKNPKDKCFFNEKKYYMFAL